MPFTENRPQNCRCHRPEKGPRPARLHATSPKTGPGAVWGELVRKRANLDARRAPDRDLSAKNVTCHQGPKLGPSERGYMQITEFEPLSHHRKLPNLGLHRMRDTKRLFGGPLPARSSNIHLVPTYVNRNQLHERTITRYRGAVISSCMRVKH